MSERSTSESKNVITLRSQKAYTNQRKYNTRPSQVAEKIKSPERHIEKESEKDKMIGTESEVDWDAVFNKCKGNTETPEPGLETLPKVDERRNDNRHLRDYLSRSRSLTVDREFQRHLADPNRQMTPLADDPFTAVVEIRELLQQDDSSLKDQMEHATFLTSHATPQQIEIFLAQLKLSGKDLKCSSDAPHKYIRNACIKRLNLLAQLRTLKSYHSDSEYDHKVLSRWTSGNFDPTGRSDRKGEKRKSRSSSRHRLSKKSRSRHRSSSSSRERKKEELADKKWKEGRERWRRIGEENLRKEKQRILQKERENRRSSDKRKSSSKEGSRKRSTSEARQKSLERRMENLRMPQSWYEEQERIKREQQLELDNIAQLKAQREKEQCRKSPPKFQSRSRLEVLKQAYEDEVNKEMGDTSPKKPRLPSVRPIQRDYRKILFRKSNDDHELSPPKGKEREYKLTTPDEQRKESERYEKFLKAPIVVTSKSVERENLSPPSSIPSPDPQSFSRSQFDGKVPFTSREVLSALTERFGRVMKKARDLIGDVDFAPEYDKGIIIKRIQDHVALIEKVENQVRAVRELDLATLDPEFNQIKYQLSQKEKLPYDKSYEEDSGKGTELYYYQVTTGRGQVVRERHLVPKGFNDEAMPSTNPDVKLYRDKKHFAKIEKFSGEAGQSFTYWWGKYKRRVHLLPDLQNEDKYTAIQEFLGGEAKKVFLGARADKKQSFDEAREYVTGLARLAAQYGKSERRIIELKKLLDNFEIKNKDPIEISTKIAELSSIKGEMLMVMDKHDSIEDLCSMVYRKMKKTIPAMIIGQVETYIANNFAKEEQRGQWSMIVDESLAYANKIVHETAYEDDYNQIKVMQDQIRLVSEDNGNMKSKLMEHFKRIEDGPSNRSADANRRPVRVNCLQSSEDQLPARAEEDPADPINLDVLNSPEFITYFASQQQRYQKNRKPNNKLSSPAVKIPGCPKEDPKFTSQADIAKFIDEIKEQPCFLHVKGKEKHTLWECCMRRTTKQEVLMNMNRCRKCLQPGHVGAGCKVNFIPVCEVCGQTGHLKLFCDLWLKEVAKEFSNKSESENNKWKTEHSNVKTEKKDDPKTTEFQTKLTTCREYKPTVLLAQIQSGEIPNPADPIPLSE
jgi:hypothetical protein